jgi:hypothetical protein
MSTATTQLTALLNNLAERAHTSNTQDFSQAIGLVSDLGRVAVLGNESDIRQAQAALSAAREQLSDNDEMASPAQALEGRESRHFLAGALWAASEMLTTRLAAMPSPSTHGRETRKGRVKEMVLDALSSGEAQSPTAILDSIHERDPDARFDEVSRALTEMLAVGLVDLAESRPGTDRRMKYLALTPEGHSVASLRLHQV